eukprot:COSAG05_NODE_949_length_6474_cov_7.735216_6_plen_86_part_00
MRAHRCYPLSLLPPPLPLPPPLSLCVSLSVSLCLSLSLSFVRLSLCPQAEEPQAVKQRRQAIAKGRVLGAEDTIGDDAPILTFNF